MPPSVTTNRHMYLGCLLAGSADHDFSSTIILITLLLKNNLMTLDITQIPFCFFFTSLQFRWSVDLTNGHVASGDTWGGDYKIAYGTQT